jgi:hypothetical protein
VKDVEIRLTRVLKIVQVSMVKDEVKKIVCEFYCSYECHLSFQYISPASRTLFSAIRPHVYSISVKILLICCSNCGYVSVHVRVCVSGSAKTANEWKQICE